MQMCMSIGQLYNFSYKHFNSAESSVSKLLVLLQLIFNEAFPGENTCTEQLQKCLTRLQSPAEHL